MSSVTTGVFRQAHVHPRRWIPKYWKRHARTKKSALLTSMTARSTMRSHEKTNTRNALARVLRYTSYCSAMVSSGRRVCVSPVDRLSCRRRGVRCRRGPTPGRSRLGTSRIREGTPDSAWRVGGDSNTVVVSHRSVVYELLS